MTKGLPRSLKHVPCAARGATKVVFNLDGKVVNITATGAANGFGGLQLTTFPQGNILITGIGGKYSFDIHC